MGIMVLTTLSAKTVLTIFGAMGRTLLLLSIIFFAAKIAATIKRAPRKKRMILRTVGDLVFDRQKYTSYF
jgi:hypothetical protein